MIKTKKKKKKTKDPLPGNACPHKFYVSRELPHKVLCAGFVQGSRIPNPTLRLNQSLLLSYFECLWRTAEEWTKKATFLKNVNSLCKRTFSRQFLCSLQKSKLLFQLSTPSSEEKAYLSPLLLPSPIPSPHIPLTWITGQPGTSSQVSASPPSHPHTSSPCHPISLSSFTVTPGVQGSSAVWEERNCPGLT